MAKKKLTWEDYPTRVIVSVPTRGEIRIEIAAWLLDSAKECANQKINVGFQGLVSPFPVDHTRNNQVSEFLKTNGTHIFLLDSDCEPEPQTIQKLLAYDLDIVASVAPGLVEGGVVFTAAMKDHEAGPNKFKMHKVKSPDVPSGLNEVDACGATGVLIKRHVLETIPYPWFKVLYRNDGSGVEMGEDFFFCTKAKQYGFKVWADFDIRQKHYKTISLT